MDLGTCVVKYCLCLFNFVFVVCPILNFSIFYNGLQYSMKLHFIVAITIVRWDIVRQCQCENDYQRNFNTQSCSSVHHQFFSCAIRHALANFLFMMMEKCNFVAWLNDRQIATDRTFTSSSLPTLEYISFLFVLHLRRILQSEHVRI